MLTKRKLISFILTIALVMALAPSMVFAAAPSDAVDYVTASAPADSSIDPRYGQGGDGTSGNQKIYFFHGADIEAANGGVATLSALEANTYGFKYTVRTVPEQAGIWENYILDKLDSKKVIKFGITISGSNTKEDKNFTPGALSNHFLPNINLKSSSDIVIKNGMDIPYEAIHEDGQNGIVDPRDEKDPNFIKGSMRGGDIIFSIPAGTLEQGKDYKFVFENGIGLNKSGKQGAYINKAIVFNFTTKVNVSGITLNAPKVALKPGATKQLSATVAPTNATDKTVKWSSSNTAVAKVSSTGKVTAVKAGTATIKAQGDDGKYATSTVYVVGTPNVKATSKSHNSVKLTWGKVTNATGYKVYRYSSKSGTYKLIKTTRELSYTNTKLTTGKKYSYKVRAYKTIDSKKYHGKYSAKDTVLVRIPAPKITLSKSSATSIKATVSKVSGADGYVVYRTPSKDGQYFKIKTLLNGKTSFTSYNKKRGTTYFYKVKSFKIVNGKRVYSKYSAVYSIKL